MRISQLPAAARTLVQDSANLVWPSTCVACGRVLPPAARLACEACHDLTLQAMRRPACGRCGRTLAGPAIHDENCAHCRSERHWNIAGMARVAVYLPALRRVVLDLKYAGHNRNAAYLAELLAAAIWQQPWAADLDALVPVPMHWLRRLQRPCDHAAALADATGQVLSLPVWRSVRRTRQTPSQVGVRSKTARLHNIRGCFAPVPRQTRRLPGRTVCIIDNLVTTGGTICEVAKALRQGGARQIYAATVVRTAAPGDPPTNPLWGLESAALPADCCEGFLQD
jgi:predicted amidophosphoribosyltransferase